MRNAHTEKVVNNKESFEMKSEDKLEDGFLEKDSLLIDNVLELHEQIASLMC